MELLFVSLLLFGIPMPQGVDSSVAVSIEYATPPSGSFAAALRVRLEQSTPVGGGSLRLASVGEVQAGQLRQRLIIVKILGECRVLSGPPAIWRPDPLGWVERVDGRILSFVFVDCTRVSEALRRIGHSGDRGTRETGMAGAVALVIRHEMRHILLQTTDHETRGEYKAALRAEELNR
jgi:hypothetical protein